jgi:hypothetical protein
MDLKKRARQVWFLFFIFISNPTWEGSLLLCLDPLVFLLPNFLNYLTFKYFGFERT